MTSVGATPHPPASSPPRQVDHAKWAATGSLSYASPSSSSEWACFNDINYSDDQRKRGGGMVCLRDRTLNEVMREVMQSHDPCGDSPR